MDGRIQNNRAGRNFLYGFMVVNAGLMISGMLGPPWLTLGLLIGGAAFVCGGALVVANVSDVTGQMRRNAMASWSRMPDWISWLPNSADAPAWNYRVGGAMVMIFGCLLIWGGYSSLMG